MTIRTIGLDLAKHVFHVHGVDAHGQVIMSRALKRAEVSRFFANIPACLVGMEACSSGHYWARTVMALGHEVRLISPQYVKPYVKTNKSDKNDAEAICEAVSRPSMRFVPVKTDEQLDILAIHRVRHRLVANKIALVNQIRGLLTERGLIIAREVASVRRRLPEILETADNGLSDGFRALLAEQYRQLQELEEQIHRLDQRIRGIYTQHEACQRLGAIEGIGPLTATALYAAAGDARVFKNGRQFAAWLGLVPRQHSSGGKPRLLGISKRGDAYLRTLLIHGGRSVLFRAAGKSDPRSQWLAALRARHHQNVAAVALANKNARIAWVLLARGETYRPPMAA